MTFDEIPCYLIPKIINRKLCRKGRTIDEIATARNYTGSISQRKFRNKPVWHTKTELDLFVAKELKLNVDIFIGPDKTSRALYTNIASEISKLRKQGLIQDWVKNKRLGIWRYTGKNKKVQSRSKNE